MNYLPNKKLTLPVSRSHRGKPGSTLNAALQSVNKFLVGTFKNVGQITFMRSVMNIRDNSASCFMLKNVTFIVPHLQNTTSSFTSAIIPSLK